MKSFNFNLHNKDKAYILTLLIAMYTLLTIVVPILSLTSLPLSGVSIFFNEYNYLLLVTSSVLLYFIFTGVYAYNIKIDSYSINIVSFRTITSKFRKKNYVEIPHDILRRYAFFNRPFTINTVLMLKIETENGKIIIQRFTLSLLSKRDKQNISNVLDKILIMNGRR